MTGETKHTPGPWQIGTPGPNGCYTVGTAQGLMTAVIAESLHDNPEVALADASLVSASPELLEALEELKDLFEMFGMLSFQDPGEGSTAWKVNQAIAKAKGENK